MPRSAGWRLRFLIIVCGVVALCAAFFWHLLFVVRGTDRLNGNRSITIVTKMKCGFFFFRVLFTVVTALFW